MTQRHSLKRQQLMIAAIAAIASVVIAVLVSDAAAATNDETSAVVPKLMNTPAASTITMPDASFDGSGTYLYGSTDEGSYLGDYTSHLKPEQALTMAGLPALPSFADNDPRPPSGSYSVTPMTESTLTNAVSTNKLAGCTTSCKAEYVGVLMGQDPFVNVSELTATSGSQTLNYSQGAWHATLDEHTTGWSAGGTIGFEAGVGDNAAVDASGNTGASFGYYSESTTGYQATSTETQSPGITVQAGHTGWIDAVYNYASYVGYYVLNLQGAGTVLIPAVVHVKDPGNIPPVSYVQEDMVTDPSAVASPSSSANGSSGGSAIPQCGFVSQSQTMAPDGTVSQTQTSQTELCH